MVGALLSLVSGPGHSAESEQDGQLLKIRDDYAFYQKGREKFHAFMGIVDRYGMGQFVLYQRGVPGGWEVKISLPEPVSGTKDVEYYLYKDM